MGDGGLRYRARWQVRKTTTTLTRVAATLIPVPKFLASSCAFDTITFEIAFKFTVAVQVRSSGSCIMGAA